MSHFKVIITFDFWSTSNRADVVRRIVREHLVHPDDGICEEADISRLDVIRMDTE